VPAVAVLPSPASRGGNLDAQAPERAALGMLAAKEAPEHVARDPEQPRGELLVGRPAKPSPAGESLRERLGGEVERGFGIVGLPGEEDQDRPRVCPVRVGEVQGHVL
jgi:hypothetical protein